MHSSLRISFVAASLALVSLFLSGCSESTSRECSYVDIDETTETETTKTFFCPITRECVATAPICLPEGETCGNNILEEGEECDDGNIDDGDGCSEKCIIEKCGNGKGGEPLFAYDENRVILRDTKGRALCQRPPKDGEEAAEPVACVDDNGEIKKEFKEVCDPNDPAMKDDKGEIQCSDDCLTDFFCGNGFVDTDFEEVCDHGIDEFVNVKKNGLGDDAYNQAISNNYMRLLEENCSPDCKSNLECNNGRLDNYAFMGGNREACDVLKVDEDNSEKQFDVDTYLYLISNFSSDALKAGGVLYYTYQSDVHEDGEENVVAENVRVILGSNSVFDETGKRKEARDLAIKEYIEVNITTLDSCQEHGSSFDSKDDSCVKDVLLKSSEAQKEVLREHLIGSAKCSDNCLSFSFCGDGKVDEGEDCEVQEIGQHTSTCLDTCKRSTCGDGVVNTVAGEECDCIGEENCKDSDENPLNDGRCNPETCLLNRAGDGFVGERECRDEEKETEDCNEGFFKEEGDEQEGVKKEFYCTDKNKWNRCGDSYVGVRIVFNENGSPKRDDKDNIINDGTEDCDEGGDSLTCDSDCTRATLGDGYVNSVSGEECDCFNADECYDTNKENREALEVGVCNPNTGKKNICGDGYVGKYKNESGSWINEECDSVNVQTKDCEETCAKPRCGDGRLNEKAGEECDSGEEMTAECVFLTDDVQKSCKKSICGDGIHNDKAGEGCDNGENNIQSNDLMRTVLDNYCQEKTISTIPDTVFNNELGDSLYKFCECPEDGSGCSLDSLLYTDDYKSLDDTKKNEYNKKRAAAEYYYVQTFLTAKRYADECLARNSEGTECQKVTCGDGHIDIGEVCEFEKDEKGVITGFLDTFGSKDRPYLPEGIICSDDCRTTMVKGADQGTVPLCGNGILENGEVCEPPIESCNECKSGQLCGNGIIDENELCDLFLDKEDLAIQTTGYCVVTASKNLDSTWIRLNYDPGKKIDLSGDGESVPENECRNENGLWTEIDGQQGCYSVTNCIFENRYRKCLRPQPSTSCSELDLLKECYENPMDPIEESNGNFVCNEGWELLDICIYKTCALASCGDGYVFDGVEKCDHGKGESGASSQTSLEQFEEYADCLSKCKLAETDEVAKADCEQCKTEINASCNYNCQKNTCGDGILNSFEEECDWGANNDKDECPGGGVGCEVCSKDCKLVSVGCGNGRQDGQEKCDYKDLVNGFAGSAPAACDNNTEYTGGYPCKVCENNCDLPNTYNKIDVEIVGSGTITSDNFNINCFSPEPEKGSEDANDLGYCKEYTLVDEYSPKTIVFSASPALGWELYQSEDTAMVWGVRGCTGSGNTLTCPYETAISIKPTFSRKYYAVHLLADEGGCLTVPNGCDVVESDATDPNCVREATCSGKHTDTISVTARAADGYTFVKWEKGCSNVSESGSSTDSESENLTCTNVIGSGWSNRAIFAKLYKVTHGVKLIEDEQQDEPNPFGSVSSTVTSGTSVISGTKVTLLAVPASNMYKFSGWTLSGSYTCEGDKSNAANPCIVEIGNEDLTAIANFSKNELSISVEAVYIKGVNEVDETNVVTIPEEWLSFSCIGQNCSATESESRKFAVEYGQGYTISYDMPSDSELNDKSVYRFASWAGCSSYTSDTCTIDKIVNSENDIKLIFYKSKFNLNFAIGGLNAGETLVFNCNNNKDSCGGLFEHNQEVKISLNTDESVCVKDANFVLSTGPSGESLSYSCDCAAATEENDLRRYTNCRTKSEDGTEATESSFDPTSFSVMMNSDKTVNVVVSKADEFLLSSAENGALVVQMHGSVLGKVGNPAQVAYYCQPGNCTSAFIEKGSDVELTATPATGYELTAWRVQVNGAVNYYDSPADGYTIDLEQGTFSFAMQSQMDVTPVFMPTLTVTASPADSATFTCHVTCESIQNEACVLEEISAEVAESKNLYKDYAQTVNCDSIDSTSDEVICKLPCSNAFSSAASVSITASHETGYSSAGWVLSDEQKSCPDSTECTFSDMNAPLTVTHKSVKQTGSLTWSDDTNASDSEFSQIDFMKAELTCSSIDYWSGQPSGVSSNENCTGEQANNKRAVKYTLEDVMNDGWSKDGYYVVSVPVSEDRKAVLTCSDEASYRCADTVDKADEDYLNGLLAFVTNPENEYYPSGRLKKDNYVVREQNALNALKGLFDKSSGGECAPGQYVQCLFQYDLDTTISAVYSDVTHTLMANCETTSNVVMSGEWTNKVGSVTKELGINACGGSDENVAQNAEVTITVDSMTPGYAIQEWQLNGQVYAKCSNYDSCQFTMPASDSTISPVISKTSNKLTTQVFPDEGSGSLKCTQSSGDVCGTNYSLCSASYEHDSVICVKAAPKGNNEFLASMNGSSCPSGNWTEDGVCKNIVMNEDKIVSAVFSTKPVVSFNSNQEGDCKISCFGNENECVGNSRYVSSTEKDIVFSAPKECVGSDSREYELLEENNRWTCPATSNQWNVSEESGENAICTLPSVTSAMTYVYAVYTEKPTLTLNAVCEEGNTECAEINCTGPEDCATGNQYSTTTPITATAGLSNEMSDYEFLIKNNSSTCPDVDGWIITNTNEGSSSSGKEATCTWNLSSSAYLAEARFTKKPTLTLAFGTAGGQFVNCPQEEVTTLNDGEGSTLNVGSSHQPTGSVHSICVKADANYTLNSTGCPNPNGWQGKGEEGISSCSVTMNGNQTVIASFDHVDSLSIAVNKINDGTLKCYQGSCSEVSDWTSISECAANVTLQAEENVLCVKAENTTGWEFDSFGMCSGEENKSAGTCEIRNSGSVSNETVLAVFKAMPTVTLVPTTAGTFIDCESGSNLEPGTTPYPSTTSQVQVCVKPNEGYELQGADGCPGTGWTAVENATDERLVGAYECEITSLSANPVVYATFSAVEAPVTKTSPVALTKIGDGELLCAEEIDMNNGTCPSEDSAYSKACENYVTENKALCIKAFGAEGDESRPETIFDQPNSRCAGNVWPNSGVCKIDYIEKNTPQSVVAYFVERYALNISVSETEQYDQTTLVQVAEATCANANSFTGFSESGSSYANGTSLCIKAMMHDKTNNTSLNIDSSSGCLWIPQTGTDGQPYYLCDVEMTSNKIITLTATEWPEVSISADVSIPSDNIDITGDYCTNDDNAVTQKCAPGTQVTLETGRFWEHNALNVDQSVCPGSSWNISYENAICEFTMIAGASVNLVYDSGSSEPGEEGENPDAGTSEGDKDAGEETDAGNNSEEATDAGKELEDAG
ncbi:MAG: InlB B-repeat-containing protein, partial [Myxococcaceae bacterium]|nr:InlB B-repeat-containing protein [Myxococcaceae bacterium]